MTQSKRRIASAFSRKAHEYQQSAAHQKETARTLSAFFSDAIPQGELLEIGCGTGFLTGEILQKYPGHPLIGIDLSEEMVLKCREQFPEGHFYCCDGENLREMGRFAAVFSSMALHWFTHPKKGLHAIHKSLKKGGRFYFSFPNARSFPEWTYFPLNPLPNVSLLLEEFGNVEFQEIEFRRDYPTPSIF